MKEIERKFLVSDFVPTAGTPSTLIYQAYVAIQPSEELRIRWTESTGWQLTSKVGRGLSREEMTAALSNEAALVLDQHVRGKPILKMRYTVGRWEVDRYFLTPYDLLVAEVELTSEDEPLPPPPPELCIVREVTGEYAYKASTLALCGHPAQSGPIV